MTVVLIVRVAAWENVHTGMNQGSVPGRGNGRKLSWEPKDGEKYKRILLYDLKLTVGLTKNMVLIGLLIERKPF